jgi:FkbM family methyltransferase
MNRVLLSISKSIYLHTPFQPIRKAYFALFLWFMRGRTKVATIEGITYELSLSELIDACIYLGQYERDVASAMERHVRTGWTILDIGANVGAHSLRLGKLVGQNGRVYAFEPTDYAFNKLQRNIALNSSSNVTPVRLALSNENREDQTINFRASWLSQGGQVSSRCLVDFRRLDDWCTEHNIKKVDFIKLDVDGNEFAVLDGARKLLAKARPILFVEVGRYHFEEHDRNPLELLGQYGYSFWDMKSGARYRSTSGIHAVLNARAADALDSVNVIASTLET